MATMPDSTTSPSASRSVPAMAGQEAAVDLDRVRPAGCGTRSRCWRRCRNRRSKARRPRRGCAPSAAGILASEAMALSVISRFRLPSAMPLPARMVLSRASKPASLSWRREKLTLTNKGGFKREIALPMGQIGRGALQRETAQLHDQSGLFGMGDEIGRRDQALDRMLPAQQRLKARHAAVGQADDGLVKDIELAGRQGMAQFAFQRHAVGGRQCFHLGWNRPGRRPRPAAWRRSAPVRHS